MKRRRVILGVAAVFASPASLAQAKLPRVGVMMMAPLGHPNVEAFRQGLREHGYVDGQNIHLVYRSAEANADKLPAIAAELVRQRVDLIVAGGGTLSAQVAASATNTIPIVFPISADPVRSGLVRSFSRPGGNVTGQAFLDFEMSAKRMQLVKELRPAAGRVALLADPNVIVYREQIEATKMAADSLDIELHVFDIRTSEDLTHAFDGATKAGADAVMSLASTFIGVRAKQVVELALRKRLIGVWDSRAYTDAGGLISYGADIVHLYRRSARYVDLILRGANPADLPVEQANKFEFVVNLKTASALGITIPPALLVRADHIIR